MPEHKRWGPNFLGRPLYTPPRCARTTSSHDRDSLLSPPSASRLFSLPSLMSSRTKNPRASAPVRFETEEPIEDFDAKSGEVDNDGDDMAEMISIMQQFHKRKSAKGTTRSAAAMQKKNAIVSDAKKKAETMARDGEAYLESCKAKISELQHQGNKAEDKLKDIVHLWTAHEESVHALLQVYPTLIDDLSPLRAKDINAASEMLETHPLAREASRRRLMKNAKKDLQTGLENQKLATDASAMIRHYKALLLS
ncbi:hypothetical protein BD410DRAFT_70773 [Rickenella mellea]|uniref:Uncharacterized protein n=1 Tax=Rickenella mellea TaxID=50990 RepID=A0A4Y7QDN5_9AGAM|nr:hypothetical protein BD410DRAFT_70773 [Rickenella mellea]